MSRTVAAALLALLAAAALAAAQPPNVVVFLTDDQGYGDLGVAGHPTIRTPNIDQLAREGTRFTQWLSANAVCSPSRTALLTGRLPVRTGMAGDFIQTLYSPAQPSGLDPAEFTLAELARERGYATAAVGKWHLGINHRHNGDGYFLPRAHGFDRFYGMPLSNNPGCVWNGTDVADRLMCFLMRDNEVVEQPALLDTLSDRLTAEAVGFVREHAGRRPFLLYYAFVQPHTPLFAAARFRGLSARGPYGDALLDVDDSVGQVMAALHETGVANNTLVFFTSDNGAWLEEGLNGGSNGLLRGGKSQTWEGGIRVPGIVWGPGPALGVRAGRVSEALVSTMDIFPTVADYLDFPVDTLERRIDGRSLRPILTGAESDDVSANERVLFHYCGFVLHSMRLGRYKAYFHTPRYTDPVTGTCNHGPGEDIHVCGCIAGLTTEHWPPLIYDVARDPSERHPLDPVTDPVYRDVLAEVLKERTLHERTLETPRSQIATPEIPALQPCCNPPECRCTEPPRAS